jgi:hypothetical protein
MRRVCQNLRNLQVQVRARTLDRAKCDAALEIVGRVDRAGHLQLVAPDKVVLHLSDDSYFTQFFKNRDRTMTCAL